MLQGCCPPTIRLLMVLVRACPCVCAYACIGVATESVLGVYEARA